MSIIYESELIEPHYGFFILSNNPNNRSYSSFVKYNERFYYNWGPELIISPLKLITQLTRDGPYLSILTGENNEFPVLRTPMTEKFINDFVKVNKKSSSLFNGWNLFGFGIPSIREYNHIIINLESFIEKLTPTLDLNSLNEVEINPGLEVSLREKKYYTIINGSRYPIETYSYSEDDDIYRNKIFEIIKRADNS